MQIASSDTNATRGLLYPGSCRKEKIGDTVVETLGEFPDSNLKRRIDDSLNVMTEEVKSSNSQLNKLKMELHSLQTKQATMRYVVLVKAGVPYWYIFYNPIDNVFKCVCKMFQLGSQ